METKEQLQKKGCGEKFNNFQKCGDDLATTYKKKIGIKERE